MLLNKYELLLTTEILLEYEEKFVEKYGVKFSNNRFSELVHNKNVISVSPFFRWNIITTDPDDNKFVDCAVAGNSDYIITNDKHFDVLKQLEFPKVAALTIYEFETLCKEQLSE